MMQDPLSTSLTTDQEDLDESTATCDGEHGRVGVRRDVNRPGTGEVLFVIRLDSIVGQQR
jgi:hypothetical protein